MPFQILPRLFVLRETEKCSSIKSISFLFLYTIMNIVVREIEKKIVGAQAKPVAVYFNVVSPKGGFQYHEGDTFFYPNLHGYPYKVTPEGLSFSHTQRRVPKVKHRVKYDSESDDWAKNFGYDPLLLSAEDLPFLKDVVEHWEKIRPHFVRVLDSGVPGGGHICKTYYFPDGTEKVWYTDRFRDRHPESLEKALERVQGKPFDATFPSDSCLYVENVPCRQHYNHGRLDYYLEQDSISIEDANTMQQSDRPQELVELLTFFSENPRTVLERITILERI